MSRSAYNYTIEVLKKVSFNPALFKKELRKFINTYIENKYEINEDVVNRYRQSF